MLSARYVELFTWGGGYTGWEGVICLFVLVLGGHKHSGLGAAGVWGVVFGGGVLLCRYDGLGCDRGCGALGDRGAGLNLCLPSRAEDCPESLHQTEAASCFLKGRAPVPAGAVLELAQ